MYEAYFKILTISLVYAALIRCNGQDISRKKSKGKNRIMMILPAQIALMKGTEGTLGMLEKADTDKPDFVMDTAEVSGII